MLENWPPAKGPKPKSLRVSVSYLPITPARSDFKFPLPKSFRRERREILSTILDHHHNKKVIEKIGSAVNTNGDYGEQIQRPFSRGALVLDYRVTDISKLSPEQASRLIRGADRAGRLISELPSVPTTTKLVYPLTTGVSLVVKPFVPMVKVGSRSALRAPSRMTVGYFLWTRAKEYERIYVDYQRYQVWGHELSDLTFERMWVRRSGEIDLLVGSY